MKTTITASDLRVFLHVFGEPTAQPRPRVTRKGNVYYANDKIYEWKKLIRQRFNQEYPGASIVGPTTLPLSVELNFWMKIPKTRKVEAGRPHIVRPDVDNLTKGVLDALEGMAFQDDKQIADLTVTKTYSDTPGVEIIVRPYA